MQDFYATLHVLPSADIDVIKAAYRALSKRYHPDSYIGDKDFATKRMQDINAAYELLGCAAKRKDYDLERNKGFTGEVFSDDAEEDDTKFKEDWETVCKFCPEARSCFDYLHKFSHALTFSFASYLLDTKSFNKCRALAQKFQNEFLQEYFGSDPEIQKFARRLLLCGEIQAAKVVNKAVKLMGRSLGLSQCMREIYKDHPQAQIKTQFFRALYGPHAESFIFLNLLKVPIEEDNYSFKTKYRIKYGGREELINAPDIDAWVKKHFGDKEEFRNIWKGPAFWR